jgi:hypothetical protein
MLQRILDFLELRVLLASGHFGDIRDLLNPLVVTLHKRPVPATGPMKGFCEYGLQNGESSLDLITVQ